MNDLRKINCAECGIPFWIEHGLRDTLTKGKTFWCPKGHGQHFIGETHSEKADRFEKLYKEESERSNQYYEQKETLKRRVQAYKGVIGRIQKNRKKSKQESEAERLDRNMFRRKKKAVKGGKAK